MLLFGVIAAMWIGMVRENRLHEAMEKSLHVDGMRWKGMAHVENRRWQEAQAVFRQIEPLDAEVAAHGMAAVDAGMREEQAQFIGYWHGHAIAELEAGRLDEAENAANMVIKKIPDDLESNEILHKIRNEREVRQQAAAVAAARTLCNDGHWQEAIIAARIVLKAHPDDATAKAVIADATAAQDKFTADLAKAKSLLEKAIARDRGEYDAQALEWLREAASLAPGNQEVAKQLEKMASYTRTLRVPEDFATPTEALAVAHDNDRIVIGEQAWRGPLIIDRPLVIQGAGSDKTIISCAADQGCAILIGPQAQGVHLTGMTFRHDAFHAVGDDRFSAALVRGGRAVMDDCRFSDASGHGLAVIENGSVSATRCRFSDNGWNGVSANGNGCSIEIKNSQSLNNFQHGIESWNGAAATLINNRCEGNCLNGIHLDNRTSSATIEENRLIANREFGLVIDSAGSGKITGNIARENLLGGYVVKAAASKAIFKANEASHNQGPGLVLEKGLVLANYSENPCTNNIDGEVVNEVNLSEPPTAVAPTDAKP